MIIPAHLAHLPAPSIEAQAHSGQLAAFIARDIERNGGAISFARYMELALYAPGLGYYSAGSRKLGADGDFITAPELSPLFARTLARQLAQLHGEGLRHIVELGAGSGALAADLLLELETLHCAPDAYFIVELSADLRERQHQLITERAPRQRPAVRWMEVLPASFEGVIIANEVLDATPVHRLLIRNGEPWELHVACYSPSPLTGEHSHEPSPLTGEGRVGVTAQHPHGVSPLSRPCPLKGEGESRFAQVHFPATGAVLDAACELNLPADNYETELNLSARVLTQTLAHALSRGVMLFIDYGFPAREFYHPQRNRGTLMCHYRHHAHDDPFAFLGLQDITTHVDFSAIAQAAHAGGAGLLGYTSQAQFLINCGLIELLSQTPASDVQNYAPLAAQVQKLTSPAEMGELFKVIALGKKFDMPLLGFARGDKSHTL